MNVGADTPEEYGDFYTYDEAVSEFGNNLPTKEQFEELKNKCTYEWTTHKEVYGYKVTGPNGKSIFFPATGSRNCNGNVLQGGTFGFYWSSTSDDSDRAWAMVFYLIYADMGHGPRCNGQSVRLVRNL